MGWDVVGPFRLQRLVLLLRMGWGVIGLRFRRLGVLGWVGVLGLRDGFVCRGLGLSGLGYWDGLGCWGL